jgi:8-oxo-dGTP diphosphatase
MTSRGRIRRAVRALVIDDDHRVLLVRLEFPHWIGWALPGGGVENGEDDGDAIRRELAEEVGLVDPELAGPIWERTVAFTEPVVYDAQAERIYFVRCAGFDPAPQLSWDLLRAEGVRDVRWWTRDELAACTELVAPSRLSHLLDDLIAAGLPASVIDVGE